MRAALLWIRVQGKSVGCRAVFTDCMMPVERACYRVELAGPAADGGGRPRDRPFAAAPCAIGKASRWENPRSRPARGFTTELHRAPRGDHRPADAWVPLVGGRPPNQTKLNLEELCNLMILRVIAQNLRFRLKCKVAVGWGVTRDTGHDGDEIHERVPRNAPPVFNLGAKAFTRMFHDGRVEPDATQPSGFRSPAAHLLPEGLDNVLAVQAMFPVSSLTEMAGQAGENPIANAAAIGNLAGTGGVWEQLAARLQGVGAYVVMFIAAFDDVRAAGDITYVHAANAIAAFEAEQWRFDNSPFDRYLRGDRKALSPSQRAGMSCSTRKPVARGVTAARSRPTTSSMPLPCPRSAMARVMAS